MSYDVFISYSHRDNKHVHPQELGWVDSFHLALDKFLTEFLGRDVEIWRDLPRMPGNVRLESAIHENLRNSKVLIPILSPNFIGSDWCPMELEFFHTNNEVAHIFPVIKSPISTPPEQIRNNFIKYKFYTDDKNSQGPREIDPSFGDEYRNKLNIIVSDLSREIAELIKGIESKSDHPLAVSSSDTINVSDNRPVIYLAEPSPDLWEQYNDIKRDLEQRGCNYLPLKIDPLKKPRLSDTFEDQVRQDIKDCRLAIHLIGGENNLYPFESRKSFLHLQTEIAAERDGESNFRRLIWTPRNINVIDKDHQDFIEQISNTASKNVEFLQNSLEDLKTCIQDALKPEPTPPDKPQREDPPWVYVLYDECDLEAARDLEFLVQAKGCEIFSSKDYIKPIKNGDAGINANELHKQWLSNCDTVLIYWNSAKCYWVKNTIYDVQKSKAYRNHDYRTNAVICDGDLENEEKLDFHSNFILLKVATKPLTNPLKEHGYSELPLFLSQLEVTN